jgi:hypothetical protein
MLPNRLFKRLERRFCSYILALAPFFGLWDANWRESRTGSFQILGVAQPVPARSPKHLSGMGLPKLPSADSAWARQVSRRSTDATTLQNVDGQHLVPCALLALQEKASTG